jgi:hypothetical protein
MFVLIFKRANSNNWSTKLFKRFTLHWHKIYFLCIFGMFSGFLINTKCTFNHCYGVLSSWDASDVNCFSRSTAVSIRSNKLFIVWDKTYNSSCCGGNAIREVSCLCNIVWSSNRANWLYKSTSNKTSQKKRTIKIIG